MSLLIPPETNIVDAVQRDEYKLEYPENWKIVNKSTVPPHMGWEDVENKDFFTVFNIIVYE